MVGLHFSACSSEAYGDLLAQLDDEFIFSKQRQIRLFDRFPGLLGDPGHLIVGEFEGNIVTSLAIQRFELSTPEARYSGVMIGLVWTHANYRNRGFARALIEHSLAHMGRQGIDFSVLWTARPEIYKGTGWQLADLGLYARTQGAESPVESMEPATIEWSIVPAIRQRQENFSGIRIDIPAPYKPNLPPFAGSLSVVQHNEAYAILGLSAEDIFVLDIAASMQDLPPLWFKVLASGKSIHINLPFGSPIARWLTSTYNIPFAPKPLAMWQRLSPRSQSINFEKVYIPFADRI